MTEIWKAVPGYEGLYEVSDAGDVQRLSIPTKLSPQDVEALLCARQRGVSSRALAPHFGVSYHAIDLLVKKRTYSQRTPHLLKRQLDAKGYFRVSLCKDAIARPRLVHQLVTEAFLGPMPDGLCRNHINGIKTDNRLVNLEYVTYRENSLHMYRVLRVPPRPGKKGSTNYRAKLHESDFPTMRTMHAQGLSYAAIGRHFGVDRSTICDALRGKTWPHMSSP